MSRFLVGREWISKQRVEKKKRWKEMGGTAGRTKNTFSDEELPRQPPTTETRKVTVLFMPCDMLQTINNDTYSIMSK